MKLPIIAAGIAAGALLCLVAGSVPAAAQYYPPSALPPPYYHNHHSCRQRVARYCPDLPPRPGMAAICAARLRLPEHAFCHGHLRIAPPPPPGYYPH